jgi:hypothetical protein
MLHEKIRSFPTGLKVYSTFDILKNLPDGNFARIAAVRGLDEVKRRINRVIKAKCGSIFDSLSRFRVLDPADHPH